MAVTLAHSVRHGRRHTIITISEVNVAAATEIEVTGIPFDVGQMTHQQTTLGAGTATTLEPGAGKVTGYSPSTQDEVFQVDSTDAAAHFNDGTVAKFSGLLGKLWVKPQPDAGADNTVDMVITLVEGHQA